MHKCKISLKLGRYGSYVWFLLVYMSSIKTPTKIDDKSSEAGIAVNLYWNSLYTQYRCNCVFKPQGPINYKLNVSHLDFWQSFMGENRKLWDVPKKFSWWTCWFSLFFFPHTLVLRTRFAHPGCAHKHCARFYFYFIFTFIWLFIAHFIEMKDINVWFLIYYAASLIALFINKLKD